MVNSFGKSILWALTMAFVLSGCMGREALCRRHCEKGSKCDEGERGYEDLERCSDRCEELADQTKNACAEEMNGWSDCMRKRYDCERGRDDACDRRRDKLRSCLNAQ